MGSKQSQVCFETCCILPSVIQGGIANAILPVSSEERHTQNQKA